jgi:hypothetical protein
MSERKEIEKAHRKLSKNVRDGALRAPAARRVQERPAARDGTIRQADVLRFY